MQNHTSNTQDDSLQSKTFWVSQELLQILKTGDDRDCDAGTQFKLETFICYEELENGYFEFSGEPKQLTRCSIMCHDSWCQKVTWIYE